MQYASPASVLIALADEATLLHYRVNALLDVVHGGEPGVAGRRAVLRNLMANGAMTVPQLAALRPTSRQHMQRVVNELLATGEVEMAMNPSHRRSRLVRITAAGRDRLVALLAREEPLLEQAEEVARGGEEVERCLALLRRLRGHLDEVLAQARETASEDPKR